MKIKPNTTEIFVATYQSPGGNPSQEIFSTKIAAIDWLRKKHAKDFEGTETSFNEWSKYGAWTAKVKRFKINNNTFLP